MPGSKATKVLPDAENKPEYVNRMFGRIAGNYDLLNTLMSLGQDRRWIREAIELCNVPAKGKLLDVGTGTGAVAREGRKAYPAAEIVAADFTWEMVQVGSNHHTAPPIEYTLGDAYVLPFEDNKFDAAISSFMMRNVVDRRAAFAEQMRVVKPGGRVVCLETSPPRLSALGPLFRLYFFTIVPIVGGLIANDREAYSYLPASTEDFPTPQALVRVMEQAGLRNVIYRSLMFNAVAIHVGTK